MSTVALPRRRGQARARARSTDWRARYFNWFCLSVLAVFAAIWIIPLLNRTTALVLVLQIIASLKIFDQIFLMTSGGPNYATRPLLEYVYDIGFTDFRTGYAAAASMLYFLVILAVSLVWFFVSRRQQQKEA